MSIESKYVTFEQAKLFKEKGFDIKLDRHWISQIPHTVESWSSKIDDVVSDGMEAKILWREYHSKDYNVDHAPAYEQWQVVEWLRIKYNIELSAQVNFYNRKEKLGYFYTLDKFDSNDIHDGKDYDIEQMNLVGEKKGFNTPQEAYSAAFDYILKNLI